LRRFLFFYFYARLFGRECSPIVAVAATQRAGSDALSTAEGRQLQQVLRRSTNRIKVRRAQVVLASAQGSKVPAIASMLHFSPQHVHHLVQEFNQHGLKALEPKDRSGRPPKFREEQIGLIAETALCPPDLLGLPFKRWSLQKLRVYVIQDKRVSSISLETLRSMLKARKVRLRRIKTWKECNDPKLPSKKN
jgi:transposase